MAERVVVDPLTRIEGHLRMEMEVEDGTITNAWSETTMFRGIEKIVEGRDPRDVWAFVGRSVAFALVFTPSQVLLPSKTQLEATSQSKRSLFVTSS